MRVPQKEAATVAAQNMLTFDFQGLTKDIEQFLSTDEVLHHPLMPITPLDSSVSGLLWKGPSD